MRMNPRLLLLTGFLAAAAISGPGPAAAQAETDLRSMAAPAVDSLLAAGRLQEAAWLARDSGDTARAELILGRLEHILRFAPRSAGPLGIDSQGVSYTLHLDHGGGVESIFKVDGSDIFCRSCGADREVASYAIDRLLGLDLTPLTVQTRIVDATGDTLSGSAMYFIHEAITPLEAAAVKPDRLRFFDAIIGNSDRHQGNWLILPGGRVVAIDHNRAFEYSRAPGPKTCWETEVDSLVDPGGLGRPFERYANLPDDSLAAAVMGLHPELAERFIDMRSRVVERIRQRADDPDRPLAHTDCPEPSSP